MKVKLLKTHHHANKLYLRDDVLEVEPHTAHWLVEHSVAEYIKETKSKTEKSVTQEQENA